MQGFTRIDVNSFRLMNMGRHLLSAAVVFTLACSDPAQVRGDTLDVKEPDQVKKLAPRKPERNKWSWNQPKAEVTPTGDLKWKPDPFVFEIGPSIRYIDFESGDDTRDGKSKTAAWKHHPWDPEAQGAAKECKGPQTYVFKGGVIYRGRLIASESGEPGNPIRLTRDPAWGKGEASIVGSERATGWKQGTDQPDIPEKEKVWYTDLPFAPRCVWELRDGQVERIQLARTPNWKESNLDDVKSEWWNFEQPQWWTGACKVKGPHGRAHIGIDTQHLTQPASYYQDAIARVEYGIIMGTPFPTRVEGYNATRKGILFQGLWFGDSETITGNCRYFLEDKPQYLDEPGEFWFDKKGEGGRLYLRLSSDRDPNTASIEVARHCNLIEDRCSASAPDRMDTISQEVRDNLSTVGLSHVIISGLTFRFTNIYWDLTFPPWMHKDIDNACIRLLGSSDDVRISHCHFENVGKALRIAGLTDRCQLGQILVTDNQIQYTDHGAINIGAASQVRVLRNQLSMIGGRAFRQDHNHALCVTFPETMEVGGNCLERVYGAGLFLHGGKAGRPLARYLVYNNRVVHSLLTANDWGGIETWEGGPFYTYNNISGDANGCWWAYSPNKPNSARLGMAYYLDGSFKNYRLVGTIYG